MDMARVHGFWANPEWFYKVSGQENKGDGTMRIGNTTIVMQNEFDKKLQAAQRLEEPPAPRTDISDRVRTKRQAGPPKKTEQAALEAALAEELVDDEIPLIIPKPRS